MKPLKDATARVVGTITPDDAARRWAVTIPRPSNDCPAPTLPQELRAQVDLLCGRAKFGDFTMHAEPTYDPTAAQYADELRRALAPAPPETIDKWLMVIATSVAPGPLPAQTVRNALMMVCGDFPAACWTRATAAMIVGKYKFLPVVAEIAEALLPIADRLRGDLDALERIAAADPATRFPTGPAREAKPCAPSPPPPSRPPRAPIPASGPDICAPVRSVDDQLAEFGITRASAEAALAARRKIFSSR